MQIILAGDPVAVDSGPSGQYQFPTPSSFNSTVSYDYTLPLGITEICAVLVGPGGRGGASVEQSNKLPWAIDSAGGGGGGLGYKNAISISEGATLRFTQTGTNTNGQRGHATLEVVGGSVLFEIYGGSNATTFVSRGTGGSLKSGTGVIVRSGGNGGVAEESTTLGHGAGGGGAAGYDSAGGTGANALSSGGCGAGGGTGLKGGSGTAPGGGASNGVGGTGRHGGSSGGGRSGTGGTFGGGGAGETATYGTGTGAGGPGGCRIIWGGGRTYPDNAADV